MFLLIILDSVDAAQINLSLHEVFVIRLQLLIPLPFDAPVNPTRHPAILVGARFAGNACVCYHVRRPPEAEGPLEDELGANKVWEK